MKKLFKFTAVISMLSTVATATAPIMEAQEENIVKIASTSEIDSLDAHKAAATATGMILDQIHDGLIDYNEKGEIIPSVAKSWEISEDGLTYTFKLVENAKFHNGKELKASDVVASYGPLAGINDSEPLSSKWEIVDDVKAIDDYTVEITLKNVDSGFLARTDSAIMPEGYDKQESHPVGVGPFKFVEWRQGEKLVMEANKDFYNSEEAAKIDGAEWFLMKDSSTAALALQTGEIDITTVSIEEKEMLGDDYNYVEGDMNMVTIFGLNQDFEPFKDAKVRQAINHAINKEEIIDVVFDGNATKLGTMFSPAMPVYYQEGLEDKWEFNPERAKELLKETGQEDLTFTIKAPSHAQMYSDLAQVISDQLSKVGVTANIEMIEWTTWLEDVYTKFDHEATIIGLTGKIDPYDVLIRFKDGYKRNFINYNNEEYNEIMNKAIQELDHEKEIEYYKEAQTILADDASSVYLIDPYRVIATQKNITGLELFPQDRYNLNDIVISE